MGKKKLILCTIVILTLAFIFGQSLLSQDVSIKESTIVHEQVVEPVHKAFTGKEMTSFDVRDIAHTIEFAILGLQLAILFNRRRTIFRGLKSVSYCGFVALVDESIQYFSGRAPQVVDIWYDILGATIGSVIGLLIVALIERTKETVVERR